MANPSAEQIGPRIAYARKAFKGHFDREPDLNPNSNDRWWLIGYVGALEDLSDDTLASLGLS